MNLRELPCGPETDILVAEAIGVECGLRGPIEDPIKITAFVKPNTIWRAFSPRNDLNDAFWAAEQVGLFDAKDEYYLKLHKVDDIEPWFVSPIIEDGEDNWREPRGGELYFNLLSIAATPALAICKAILKFNEDET